MIERVIENWLVNTNERGYEIPFCQYLISKGYTILGLSFHGPMEQGKDVITLDEKGVPCAFQLKSGDINDAVWKDIKGEIDALVEIPIKYPLFDKSIMHRCVLVTNGRITDKVRVDIDDRNARYKQLGLPQLEIILGNELLGNFVDVKGTFFPTKLPDLKTFLELFLFEGRDLLDMKLFASFLESILLTEGENTLELGRKIASSILLTQYVMEPYESQNNHIAIIEGWTILYSYVLLLVERFQLEEKFWFQSLQIVIEKIHFQLRSLKDEFFLRTDYLEGDWDGALFYKSRMTIVLGWLSAFELYMANDDSDYLIDNRVYSSLKKLYGNDTWFWGESATPLFVMMSKLAQKSGDSSLSNKIICDLIIDIAFKNALEEKESLPDPYYSVKQLINHNYGSPEEKIDLGSFSGQSYHLAVLVDILVRKDRRDLLSEVWKRISYIANLEFRSSSLADIFKWHCNEGEELSTFYSNPQSWSELRKNALDSSNLELPKNLVSPFCYYFVVCYPHRLTVRTGKVIDSPDSSDH